MTRSRIPWRGAPRPAPRPARPPAFPGGVLALQRQAGNAAVAGLLQSGAVRRALVRALRDYGEKVSPNDLTISDGGGGGFFRFGLRVSRDRHALPGIGEILKTNPSPGTVPGALYMLQGAVQCPGDIVRVTARLVSVETSVILGSGMGDGPTVLAAARLALERLGPLADLPDEAAGGRSPGGAG